MATDPEEDVTIPAIISFFSHTHPHFKRRLGNQPHKNENRTRQFSLCFSIAIYFLSFCFVALLIGNFPTSSLAWESKNNKTTDPASHLRSSSPSRNTGALSPEVGRTTLSKVVHSQAKSRNSLLKRAQELYEEGKFQEAIREAEKVIEDKPDCVEAYALVGEIYIEIKQYEKARKYLDYAMKKDPSSAINFIHLGESYFEAGKYDKAMAIYKKVAELYPDNADAALDIGEVYVQWRNYRLAEYYLKKAMHLRPDYFSPYNELGNLYLELRRYKEAEKFYKESLKRKPDYVDAMIGLGKTYIALNKFPLAEQYLNQAIKLIPEYSGEALVVLGQIIRSIQQKFDEAEKLYKKAIQTDADNAIGYYYLGMFYYRQQRFDEAEAILKKGLKICPETEYTADMYFNLANIYRQKGDMVNYNKYYYEAIKNSAVEIGDIADIIEDFLADISRPANIEFTRALKYIVFASLVFPYRATLFVNFLDCSKDDFLWALFFPSQSEDDLAKIDSKILPTQNHTKPVSSVVNPKDGAPMVLIPHGFSYIGAPEKDQLADASEKPLRKVYLDDYYIYTYEVTLSQFKKFVEETGYKTTAEQKGAKFTWRSQLEKYPPTVPVAFISWRDADAYCKWAGGSLPTEAQWEKAARGTSANAYPWGDEMDRTRFNNELQDAGSAEPFQYSDEGSFCSNLKPVGSFPSGNSPYGVSDMLGNVWEWVDDWYERHHIDAGKYAIYHPRGPKTGKMKILKGGGYCNDIKNYRVSCRDRNLIDSFDDDTGFRVVIYPGSPVLVKHSFSSGNSFIPPRGTYTDDLVKTYVDPNTGKKIEVR